MSSKEMSTSEVLAGHVEQVAADLHKGGHGVDKETADLMAVAIKESKLKRTSRASLRFYGFLFVAYCNSWGTGFDSSLFSALNSNTQWHTYFDVPLQGATLGIVTAMITIGYIAGAFFAGPASDRWGRRWGMFIGSVVVVLAAILMTAGTTRSTFMAGRFFMGVGASICSAAAASWVAESAPPQWRGPAAYLFNSLYLPGAILSSGIAAGTGHMKTDWSWRIPVIVQIIPSMVVVLFVLLLPESPRWLILNDRIDEAKQFVTTYHADGDENAPLVALQMFEMRQAISQNASDKRWYDYSEFVATRANRWRLFQVVSMAFIGQWGGSAVTGYYQANVLRSIGITSQNQLLTYNMGYYIAALGGALIGTSTSNHVGRRPMLMLGNIAMAIIIAGLAASTAHYDPDQPMALSRFTVALIFLVGVFHAGAINPLVIAFPAEVLHTNIRGKGMGINQFCIHVAELLNDYAIPIALQAIAWHIYIIFACWNVVQTLWVYFFFVETKGHTLEEMDYIFEAKSPVKESLKRHASADEVLHRQAV